MGTLTKQIYRYTHKRNMRHNENLWPFVKLQRNEHNEITNLTYRDRKIALVSLSSLHKKYSGEILITATGPSINEIDFSQLPASVKTAGVNGAWHLHDELQFKFYFVVDMTFIDQQTTLMKKIVACESMTLFTTVMGIVKLVDLFSYDNIQCKIAIIEDICYETYKPSVKLDELRVTLTDNTSLIFSDTGANAAFSRDIRKGVVDAGTVVYWALQVVYFMGFSKIYIAGLDMKNFAQPRFYENDETMAPSFLDNKVHDIVIPAMNVASQQFAKESIEVVNLSTQSAIPSSVFPRKDFSDVFK